MAKLILTHDGAVIKEYPLDKERVTIGRKPHNDIQLDDNTVSGEHAVLITLQNIYVEDLGSTNGTLLNGERIKKRMLNQADMVKIGRHEFKFIDDTAQDFENTVIIPSVVTKTNEKQESRAAFVEVISGPKNGERIPLNKAYTTLGSPGVSVAVIARRGKTYFIMPMGAVSTNQTPPSINNTPIGSQSLALTENDIIEVAGSRLKFVYH